MIRHAYECGSKIVFLDKKSSVNYYHDQRNNKINPFGACNITCLNMVFDYYGLNYTDDEIMEMTRSPDTEKYYKKYLLKSFGDLFLKQKRLNTIWTILEKIANDVFTANKIRYKAVFINNVSNIREYIDRTAMPVMLSTTLTKSGHIVLATGYVQTLSGYNTHYIINDPYGNPLVNYSDHNGRMVRVPIDWFAKKVKRDRAIIFEKMI